MKTNLEAGMAQVQNCDSLDTILIATVVIASIITAATLYVYFEEKKEKEMFYGQRKGADLDDWDEFQNWDR